MLIIPAIDIIGGNCVRLTKGDFSSKKTYSSSPLSVARRFETEGADMLHIVDLDGAKAGSPKNSELIMKLRSAVKIPLEVGGGIRTFQSAAAYLERGINRIIMGTTAVQDRTLLKKLLKKFGAQRIVVAIDFRDEKIATNGWQKNTTQDVYAFARELQKLGVTEFIATDIARDGMLSEPNFKVMAKMNQLGMNVVASGGISDTKSLKKLKKIKMYGAILGKALYEKKLTIASALNSLQTSINRTNSNLTKRIIPCLDVQNGRVVKGVNFKNVREAGDAIKLAKKYAEAGADELIFLDITASQEGRKTVADLVEKVTQEISIPFTVGGGITTVDEIQLLLQAGADKISLNTAAVLNPGLITEAAQQFGSQCIVVAIDVKKTKNIYRVFIKAGREQTELDAVTWAKKVEELGAGEILLTSMDCDGTKKGFDLKILKAISQAVTIPVIASGGAGSLKDFQDAFQKGYADAVLAASLFHYNIFSINAVKKYLQSRNIPIRL